MSEFPQDIHEIVLNQVYKKGLPKVPKNLKMREPRDAMKKVNQICDYKSFDKKSLENQEKKLKDMFVAWLLWNGSRLDVPLREKETNFIGKNKALLMDSAITELKDYWTNNDIQNYFCHLIKSVNFKNGNRLTPAWDVMKGFIIICNENNLLKKKPFDDIILDTVKNNRSKICRFLDNEFRGQFE
jgi:hypothetical protein